MTAITRAQNAIWENKLSRGFNTTDVALELLLLQTEFAELFDAWHRDKGDVHDELADVAIYVLSLARMLDVDLETAVALKIETNRRRRYVRQGNGHVKDERATGVPPVARLRAGKR